MSRWKGVALTVRGAPFTPNQERTHSVKKCCKVAHRVVPTANGDDEQNGSGFDASLQKRCANLRWHAPAAEDLARAGGAM
jgi:hypothetical protein